MTLKEKILDYDVEKAEKENRARNRMGCSELWHDPYYAINRTFTKEELEAMSDQEIFDLDKLADMIAEYLQ